MSKGLKIFLISLLVLFTIAASLFIYIYQHVDQLKKYALEEVNVFLKSELEAKQLDVSFWRTFPKVSLALHEVSLSDPLKSKIKVLKAKNLYLGFDLYDVLNEQYRINYIELDSGSLVLYTNKKGKNNFDILKENKDAEPSKKPFSFELKKLVLTQMQLEFVNEKNGFKIDTYLDEAKFAGKFSDTKFNMSLILKGFTKQLKTASLELVRNKAIQLNTELAVDQKEQKYTINKGEFTLDKLALALQGWVQTGKKQSDIDLNFTANKL
ncbi:MAG: AsmA family protein, partial [Bacteroidia bacterium]|nr:AsmA family protein [Bacteroidia bacterium]